MALLANRLRYMRWDGPSVTPEPSDGDAYPERGEVTASRVGTLGPWVHVRIGNRNRLGEFMNWADLTPQAARELASDLVALADQLERQ